MASEIISLTFAQCASVWGSSDCEIGITIPQIFSASLDFSVVIDSQFVFAQSLANDLNQFAAMCKFDAARTLRKTQLSLSYLSSNAHLVGMTNFEDAARGISDTTRLMDLIEPTSVRLMREQDDLVSRYLRDRSLYGLPQNYADAFPTFSVSQSLMDSFSKVIPTIDTVAMQMANVGRTLALATQGSTAMMREVGDAFTAGGVLKAMESTISSSALWQQAFMEPSVVDGIGEMAKAAQGFAFADADRLAIQSGLSVMASALNTPSIHSVLAQMQTQYFASLQDADVGIPDEIAYDPRAYAERFIQYVAVLAEGFKANSKEQLKGFGIFDLMMLLGLFITIQSVLNQPATYSEAEQLADETLQESVEDNAELLENIDRSIADLTAIVEQRKIDWIESLDRAVVISERAKVRELPQRKADALAQLAEGQNVAIVTKKGRWLQIIYADPVTSETAEGWIYESSIEALD